MATAREAAVLLSGRVVSGAGMDSHRVFGPAKGSFEYATQSVRRSFPSGELKVREAENAVSLPGKRSSPGF